MIIKKDQLKKYLTIGCRIKCAYNDKEWTITGIGEDRVFIKEGFIFLGNIKQIISYEIPTDIETNHSYVGHYFKMKCDGSKHSGYWFNGEWGRIKKLESYMTYKITFDYLNKRTDNGKPETACSKNEIDVYNPFYPEPIVVEEAVLNERAAPERREFRVDDNALAKVSETFVTNLSKQKITMKDLTDNMGSYIKDLEKSKQKLNFDVLLNSQKIVLD